MEMPFAASFLLLAQFLTTIQPATIEGFDAYFAKVDAEVRALAASPQPLSKRPLGVQAHAPGKEVGNGMLHDWSATEFIPGARKTQVVDLLHDFERHASIYPEVMLGRLEQRDGSRATGFHRVGKKKFIEIVFDIRYQMDVLPSRPNRFASRSVTTEIIEVEKAGTPKERRLTGGRDHGYLWRLNSFWVMEETPEGLWLHCRSVSLSRDTPPGLGWAIRPFVKDLPRESLEQLMGATKKAIISANARYPEPFSIVYLG
jgi:hypothetical protein